MKIVKVEAKNIRYQSVMVRDGEGHSHPGKPHDAKVGFLTITCDDGTEGHAVGGNMMVDVLNRVVGPALIGEDPFMHERIWQRMRTWQRLHSDFTDRTLCAMDLALWDICGKKCGQPVYKLLGGARRTLVTDITISVNPPEEMARDALDAVARGYDCLKVKVGADPALDTARLAAVRKAVGDDVCIRIDANQAWTPRQAVRILNEMQDKGLALELVEQPVPAADLEGLAYVTRNSWVPVMADESVFSPADAMKIFQNRAADYINIKLMKCGGITNALRIAAAAEVYGVECMIGCMLEAKIAVNAAVELACARSIITRVDLDGPVLCSVDPIQGGARFDERLITVSDDPGLGIHGIDPAYFSSYFSEEK